MAIFAEQHAFRAESDDQIARGVFLKNLFRHHFRRGLGKAGCFGRKASHLERFLPIRREQIEPFDVEWTARLGVERDQHTALMRNDGKFTHQFGAKRALRVVGKNHGLGAGKLFGNPNLGGRAVQRVDGGLALTIKAAQLLMAGDDPGLHDGGGFLAGKTIVEGHAGITELGAQFIAGRIAANPAAQFRLGPERDEIERDIGRATRDISFAFHGNDGHRGFGRQAVGLAGDVFVEHHVADDNHAESEKFGQKITHKRMINYELRMTNDELRGEQEDRWFFG